MLKYALAVGLVGAVGRSISSQESGCPGDAQRAQTAVRFVREVNTAQARYQAQNKRYGRIADLGIGAEPEGFRAQMTTDGTTVQFLRQGHGRRVPLRAVLRRAGRDLHGAAAAVTAVRPLGDES